MFERNSASVLQFIFYLALSIGLLFFDHYYGQTHNFRSYLAVLTSPLEYSVTLPLEFYDKMKASVSTHHRLLRENEHLRGSQLLLQAQVQRFKGLEKENRELRALLKSTPKHSHRLLVAQLLAVNSEPITHQLVLDRGTRDGVYMGQPVLDAKGVVGQVVHAGPFTTRVLLITDNSSAVPVQNSRNGIRAIAVGTGMTGKLKLKHVPTTTDIKPGDLMLTSGLGQRYPEGYPVGTVQSIQQRPGDHFATIVVDPTAGLNRSRLMLLVWPNETTVPKDMLRTSKR